MPRRTRSAPSNATARPAREPRSSAWRGNARRAFAEFLAVPTAIIVGFVLLAVGLYALERQRVGWLGPVRQVLEARMFVDAKATADLLGTIAGGLITVTSITISLLLLALQQTAASLSSAVFDQFLRRRHNQFYFGFFVGLALYALITLASVNAPFNPVLAASLALVLTILALFLLIVLLYTTINQMRPVEIIEAIHDLTLVARTRQLVLIGRTRRAPAMTDGATTLVRCSRHGYVTGIDLALLGGAALARGGAEVVLRVAIGSYVATGDVIAEVRTTAAADGAPLGDLVHAAVRLERKRDIDCDPANGIEGLETIGWTSISTAKSNPAPGLLTIRSLRDLLARWSGEQSAPEGDPPVPVVYVDDVFERLMAAFESLAIVSSESMQHQAFTEVVRALTASLDRLGPAELERADDVIRRALSALGDHVLTADLDAALAACERALAAAGRQRTAAEVADARRQLGRSVGRLGARSTRAVQGESEQR